MTSQALSGVIALRLVSREGSPSLLEVRHTHTHTHTHPPETTIQNTTKCAGIFLLLPTVLIKFFPIPKSTPEYSLLHFPELVTSTLRASLDWNTR